MKLFYLEVLSKTSKDKGKQQVVFQYVSLESGCDGKGIFLTRYQEYVWEKRMTSNKSTVFENHRKRLIRDCERREQCLHFWWTKVN